MQSVSASIDAAVRATGDDTHARARAHSLTHNLTHIYIDFYYCLFVSVAVRRSESTLPQIPERNYPTLGSGNKKGVTVVFDFMYAYVGVDECWL
jgi:hypothetical protein